MGKVARITDGGWLRGISSGLRHTSHARIITRHRRSVEVPLSSHTLLSVYILHTPAVAVQHNLLTGRETTKASLAEYMLNTPCVFVCDWFRSVNTLDSMPLFYYYVLKREVSKIWALKGIQVYITPPTQHTHTHTLCVCMFVCVHKLHVLAMMPPDTLSPPFSFPFLYRSTWSQLLHPTRGSEHPTPHAVEVKRPPTRVYQASSELNIQSRD